MVGVGVELGLINFLQTPCSIYNLTSILKHPRRDPASHQQDPNIKQGSSLKAGMEPARYACGDV